MAYPQLYPPSHAQTSAGSGITSPYYGGMASATNNTQMSGSNSIWATTSPPYWGSGSYGETTTSPEVTRIDKVPETLDERKALRRRVATTDGVSYAKPLVEALFDSEYKTPWIIPGGSFAPGPWCLECIETLPSGLRRAYKTCSTHEQDPLGNFIGLVSSTCHHCDYHELTPLAPIPTPPQGLTVTLPTATTMQIQLDAYNASVAASLEKKLDESVWKSITDKWFP